MTWVEIIDRLQTANKKCTAKEIGCAPATLTAAIKRKIISATNTTPKQYYLNDISLKYKNIIEYAENCGSEFFGLIEKELPIGMLCRLKGNDILDAYDNFYPITTNTNIIDHKNGKRFIKEI